MDVFGKMSMSFFYKPMFGMSIKGYKSFCLMYFIFYRPIIYPIGNGGCFAVAAHLETKYKGIYKIKH